MADELGGDNTLRVERNFLIWTVVCVISAAPSFIWGLGFSHVPAMLTGIFIFILAYTAVSSAPPFERFKRRPFIHRTIKIGYGTRIGLSLAFPVGLFVDAWCGALAIELTGLRVGSGNSFLAVLATTLVQGVILNCILVVYMALVYGVQRLFLKPPPTQGLCASCGYDLRASKDICPECGTPVQIPSTIKSSHVG